MSGGRTQGPCEVEWNWDVHFGVMCMFYRGHSGSHKGLAFGNGNVEATIEWTGPEATP